MASAGLLESATRNQVRLTTDHNILHRYPAIIERTRSLCARYWEANRGGAQRLDRASAGHSRNPGFTRSLQSRPNRYKRTVVLLYSLFGNYCEVTEVIQTIHFRVEETCACSAYSA